MPIARPPPTRRGEITVTFPPCRCSKVLGGVAVTSGSARFARGAGGAWTRAAGAAGERAFARRGRHPMASPAAPGTGWRSGTGVSRSGRHGPGRRSCAWRWLLRGRTDTALGRLVGRQCLPRWLAAGIKGGQAWGGQGRRDRSPQGRPGTGSAAAMGAGAAQASAGGTGSASERGGGLAGRVGPRLLPCRQPCKVAAPAHQSPSTPARVMGSEREKAACTGQTKGSRIVVVLLGATARNLNLTAFNDHDVPSGL